MVSVSRVGGLAKRVFSDFSEKNVTFMAAGIAYNAFVSLAPMLLILFLILSLFGGRLEERIMAVTGNWLPGPIASVINQLFYESPSAAGVSLIGFVVLVWGTLKIFRGLDTAFSEIYETESSNSFADALTDGIVVFVALIVAVVATVGVSTLFAIFSDTLPFLGLLTPLVLVVGLAIAFFPIYYVFPDVDVGVRGVLPGVIFAAVGWAVLQGLFQVYLTFRDPSSGSFFGGVIIIITYLYFSGLVLLLGAVINAVVGNHSSGKPGGVGQGATSYNTELDESLNRDELAAYLQGLREELTGHYEEMRASVDDTDRHPRPDGDVDLTEHSSVKNGTRKWTVTLRWDAAEETRDNESPPKDRPQKQD